MVCFGLVFSFCFLKFLAISRRKLRKNRYRGIILKFSTFSFNFFRRKSTSWILENFQRRKAIILPWQLLCSDWLVWISFVLFNNHWKLSHIFEFSHLYHYTRNCERYGLLPIVHDWTILLRLNMYSGNWQKYWTQ